MFRKKSNVIIIVLVAIALIWWLTGKKTEHTNQHKALSYKTYAVNSGWGYRIFASDTILVVQQDVIPGIPGTKAFDSEEKAAKTARLVLSKIVNGIFPPTLSFHELDSLNVLPETQQ